MSDNLPPGVTNSHPYFNPPDTDHKHEWMPSNDYPTFEDGAAIFIEECVHETVLGTERGYEGERVVTDSIPCEETRSFRFEYDSLTYPDGKEVDLPPFDEIIESPRDLQEQIIEIEEAVTQHPEQTIVDVDSDPDNGQVTITYDGYTLRYE